MRFPLYRQYKNSGIDWIEELPSHWAIAKLHWLAILYSGGTPDKTNLDFWEDGTIPWLNSGAVNDRIINEASTYITKGAFENSSAKWIPQGALVMALAGQGKTKGMVARMAISSTCNQSMAAIVPGSKIFSSYLFWWLDSNYLNIRNMAGGDLRDGLNLELLGNIFCPLPTFVEQRAIAAFLDEETARIDSLIADYESLIALLREERQATIAHVVTKGLNPDVPMRDSGAEWLGEVPEHWSVKALKWESTVQRGASPRPIEDPIYFDEEGEYAWVRISDVTASDVYLRETGQRLSHIGEMLSVKLQPGTLFLSIAGSVGKPCITIIRCCIHDGFVWFPAWRKSTKFLYYVFASGQPYKGLGKMGTQLNLNTDTIGSIYIGIPSLEEQCAISAFLDAETARIDSLVADAEKAIALLRESRTALISDAVTGKIDVRDWQGAA